MSEAVDAAKKILLEAATAMAQGRTGIQEYLGSPDSQGFAVRQAAVNAIVNIHHGHFGQLQVRDMTGFANKNMAGLTFLKAVDGIVPARPGEPPVPEHQMSAEERAAFNQAVERAAADLNRTPFGPKAGSETKAGPASGADPRVLTPAVILPSDPYHPDNPNNSRNDLRLNHNWGPDSLPHRGLPPGVYERPPVLRDPPVAIGIDPAPPWEHRGGKIVVPGEVAMDAPYQPLPRHDSPGVAIGDHHYDGPPRVDKPQLSPEQLAELSDAMRRMVAGQQIAEITRLFGQNHRDMISARQPTTLPEFAPKTSGPGMS